MMTNRLGALVLSPATLTASWIALVCLWLASIQGIGNPDLSRMLALWASSLAAIFLLRQARPLLDRQSMPWGPLFLGLLLASFIVGFTGLAHEVGTGYYTDEGHYLHHARRVASGELFTGSMIYPHLLYYLDAFALWLSDLFPKVTHTLARAFYGIEDPRLIPWLVLRWVGALLASSAVIPVALVAKRLAGALGGIVAGGAMIFASQFHLGFHVNTCDVPSAAFAAWCLYFVSRLQEQETSTLYAAAGYTAGLAAATKYPAGVVAVAIVATWLIHRIQKRTFDWGLLIAAATALVVFLASNPSFFVYPEATLFGKRGLFFGVRQYSEGGWIGVMPTSKVVFYWQQLVINFGLPMLAIAVPGFLGLDPAHRRRWLGLAVFPAVYFALISSMNMVVVRNLFPAIPAFALLLGAAVGGLGAWFLDRRPVVSTALTCLLLGVAWWQPARSTVLQSLALNRPSTREAMTTWVHQNVPRGAGILKESYTPNFSPEWFRVREQRFALKFPPARFSDPSFDFLLLASQAHGRFFRPEHQTVDQAAWYRDVFERFVLVHEEGSEAGRLGPHLYLLRLAKAIEPRSQRLFRAEEAFVSKAAMKNAGTDLLIFRHPGHEAIFYEEMRAGRYEITAADAFGSILRHAEVEVRDLSGQGIGSLLPDADPRAIDLPADGKYFFSLRLPSGSHLASVQLEREKSR